MDTLLSSTCSACTAGAQALDSEQKQVLLDQIPGWSLVRLDAIERLQRQFHFADFKQALAFSNALGALAEQHNHHPALLTEWGKVTVSWWSHSLKGLHRNDFIMAAHTSQTAEQFGRD